jgi:hypothetical protein
MNQQQPGHRRIIAAALEDWWITTDPVEPFAPDRVADQVDLYLISSGYHISPDTRRTTMPSRLPTRGDIASGIVLAVLAAIATIQAAVLGHEWWALIGGVLTVVLIRDTAGDIRDRRDARRALDDLDGEMP